MPKTKRTEFNKKGFDHAQWNKYFRLYQQEYIRKRLRTIQLFAEQNDVPTISKTLSLNKNSVYTFLKLYLKEGFEGLCRLAGASETNFADHHTRTSFQTNYSLQSSV